MKKRFCSEFKRRNTVLFLFIILCGCTSNHESEIKELHRKYMNASMNHDIETLKSLTHDDVLWILGSDTLIGKPAALAPNEYDAGYETILRYNNVVIKGDTVWFELFETNDQVKFFGMDWIRLYPKFIFKNGLVYRKMPWKQSSDMSELMRRSQPFIKWVKTNHPEAMQIIRKPNDKFNFSFETGQLLRQLFNQWRNEITSTEEFN